MLAIRMQRTGRSSHAQYRVIVQDSRFSPTSGRVVAYLGSYNPHTKEAILDGEKASAYLTNGAQPSERVVKLLKAQGVKVPKWVAKPTKKNKSIRNAEKLRRNRPAGAVVEAPEPEAATADETPFKEPEVVATAEPEVAAVEPETPSQEVAAEEPVELEPAPAEAEAPAEPAPEQAPASVAEPKPEEK